MHFIKDPKPLTNLDLEELVNGLKVNNYQRIFIRDTLPTQIQPRVVEIVNLDSSDGQGTH